MAERFMRVNSFLSKPPALLSPGMVARVLAGSRRARRADPVPVWHTGPVTPEPVGPEPVKAGMHEG